MTTMTKNQRNTWFIFSLQTSGPVAKQNWPLPPIPTANQNQSGGGLMIYQPPSVVSNISSSTTENKYETIGKSLEPYKINKEEDSSKNRYNWLFAGIWLYNRKYLFLGCQAPDLLIPEVKATLTTVMDSPLRYHQ